MPVTSSLTVVVEATCVVSVSGSTVDAAVLSDPVSPEPAAGVMGCCVQPIANSIKNAARYFSFIRSPF